MEGHIKFILFCILLHIHSISSAWRCARDEDCTSLPGGRCDLASGTCLCPPGLQAVQGATACVEAAPYLMSPCIEDQQCSRLFTGFQCLRSNETSNDGHCFCRPGFHHLHGRCWRSIDFGETCNRDEECLGIMRSPFSMACNDTCQCAEGFYERQRGDCRKIGFAVGDGCVLNVDCQFPGGVCDINTLKCTLTGTDTVLLSEPPVVEATQMAPLTTVSRVECNDTTPCASPFQCSVFGVCICPLGYYESANGQTCLAELGSPSTNAQCVGFLAVVRDGICSCPANFFYEENMRDCIRVTRRISDSCLIDAHCHTFGAASRCGLPQEPWGLRTCECIPELAIWDAQQSLCRYFSAIGGSCETNADCRAGELEIDCVKNGTEQGVCTCPYGLTEFEGLCLTSGLDLGERCQHNLECSGSPNMVCNATNLCDCADGYQSVDNVCAPIIGGTCTENSDCLLENTECRNSSTGLTCQCKQSFLPYNDICWPVVSGNNASCSVPAQCVDAIGPLSDCVDNRCTCDQDTHYRDGNCWPVTHLLERCSRVSECYLHGASERVVCRNGHCHCDFQYYYSEELQTCLSSGATTAIVNSLFLFSVTFIGLFYR